MILAFYQLVSFLASFVVAPFFFISTRGRKHLSERFGFWNLKCNEIAWFHGASVGEVCGLAPVIDLFKKKYPAIKILITTTSLTGREKALSLADFAYLMPFDNSLWHKHALKNSKLALAIISETEIWPAQLDYLKKRGVPTFLVNGRISDFSLPRYKFLKRFFKNTCDHFEKILVANQEAKERFQALGASAEQIVITGNSKYDIPPAVTSKDESLKIRQKFFNNSDPVLVLGSIRPGEEQYWLSAIKEAYQENKNFNVIVAPRHKEKFEFFANALARYAIEYDRWSKLKSENSGPSSKSTILLDTLGDLEAVYSFSSLAFIGATLQDLGGHNPLEAAAYRVCICLGPYYKNIREVVASLQEAQGIVIVKDTEDVLKAIRMMVEDKELTEKKGQAAYTVWKSNAGSGQRIIDHISF